MLLNVVLYLDRKMALFTLPTACEVFLRVIDAPTVQQIPVACACGHDAFSLRHACATRTTFNHATISKRLSTQWHIKPSSVFQGMKLLLALQIDADSPFSTDGGRCREVGGYVGDLLCHLQLFPLWGWTEALPMEKEGSNDATVLYGPGTGTPWRPHLDPERQAGMQAAS
ncbi:hypothetical protein P4O66_022403 [Electrophorus voltai]|uniref:Uncharacterized protein n=1 Tax=Electrophorus voltai TaxID=2609070 RepID=A0AAD8ZMD9_9TELE|nr:hypothetical protein P4O66_022403 [Electrophorus voltai]